MPVIAGTLAVQLTVGSVVVLVRSAAAVADPLPAPLLTSAPLVNNAPALGGLRPAVARVAALRLWVPALQVDAAVVRLGVTPTGELQVPGAAGDVGLWSGGVVPGDVGAAVLVGHVDLDGRPGVFAQLAGLQPGAAITVRRPDGREVAFVVNRLEQHRKTAFPTDAVYGPTDTPELRLVTCGGGFDRRTGHYRDNVVVFASAV